MYSHTYQSMGHLHIEGLGIWSGDFTPVRILLRQFGNMTDPDEGHKPKHIGLPINFFFILQVLLEFLSLRNLEVGEVVPEIPTLLLQDSKYSHGKKGIHELHF